MRMKTNFLALVLVFGLTAMAYADNVTKSTLDDQDAVEVTVYNSNLGLIKDTRKINLPTGTGELKFMDVASFIMPVTVHAKSLSAPNDFAVLEQNYEYDLMNDAKLLDKYVGKKIKLVTWNQFQDRKETVDAVLLSNNQGQIYKINDEIYLGYPGTKILPAIPDNLIAEPTLTWMYNNTSKSPHQLEVSYLTNNISWKADYVLVLDQNDAMGDLSGWVTIDNKSGAIYKNAGLKLVAGEVNRVEENLYENKSIRARQDIAMAGAMAPQFQEQGFFEYHIYDLQRKTTIKDNETKQISLLEAKKFKIKKELLVHGQQNYYTSRYNDRDLKQPVNVYVAFKNSEENRLGMPLPAGVMRLYKEDQSKKLQFIGEDKIEHTPKDEEVRLKIGEAFDVVAERRQTDFKQLTTRMYETEWEVTLRNHKKEDITVGIIEPLYGNWTVISNSHPFVKKDAFTIRFDVDVPKDKEVKVQYRVRVGI